MFSGPIALLILVVFIPSGSEATSATVNPTSASVTIHASQTVKASTVTPSSSASSAKSSAPPPEPPPTTLVVTSTVKPTTSPTEKTCARLSFVVNASWDEAHGNKSSDSYKAVSGSISNALTTLYNSGNHEHVEVLNVTFTQKDKLILAEVELSLVFKGGDDDFIEDVFIKKVETGKLSENLAVIKDSAKFEALGVTFKDWEVKEGECKKCEGTGGPFKIVGTCEVKTNGGCSCKGLRKKTKESDECVEYCPSSSAAITVSTLILAAIGIFFAFSFQ